MRLAFLRFFLTFGILSLGILVLSTAYYQPIKKYVLKTQEYTSFESKIRILGYQTPDFKKLAHNLLEEHVFKDRELNNYLLGVDYLSFFKKGSELFPNNFEMFYMEGICYFWQGDLSAAQDALQKSLQINPVFFWGYYNLGLLEMKRGHLDAAIALFSLAQKVDPQMTKKCLHDLQAFFIIWQYMPDAENFINGHLQKAHQQVDYFLLVALAVKNHHLSDVHFNPDQWNPVFF